MTITLGPQTVAWALTAIPILIFVVCYIRSFFMWLKVKDALEMPDGWGGFFYVTSMLFSATIMAILLLLFIGWIICLFNGHWWFYTGPIFGVPK